LNDHLGRVGRIEYGVFDMAVNGGGVLTLRYEKSGFLPVQRQVNTPWQDFVVAPDVVMIPLDTQVTAVAANAAVIQVARGSVASDVDGTRQATMLFAPGTAASMTLPDGSTQALTTLNDEMYVEAAQGLARRVLTEAPPDEAGRLRYAFRLCVGREPDGFEKDTLSTMLRKSGSEQGWLDVARVLLNLDETITRE